MFLLLALSGCQSGLGKTYEGYASKSEQKKVLLAYAAAGTRWALEEIAEAYNRQETADQVEVRFVFNSTGRLLSQIELSGEGDIYISADNFFMEKAVLKGLVTEYEHAALFVPAIIVPQGNPQGIGEIQDLARPGLRVILCEESAAMGRAAERILKDNGLFESVSENVTARVATAPQVALNIALGQGDAGITGRNSVGEMQDKVEVIAIPPGQNSPTKISVGVLESTANPEQARNFMQFILSPAGQAIFVEHGFGLPGD